MPRRFAAIGYSSLAMPDALTDEQIQDFVHRLVDGFKDRDHHLVEGMVLNGKVVAHWEFADVQELLAQLKD